MQITQPNNFGFIFVIPTDWKRPKGIKFRQNIVRSCSRCPLYRDSKWSKLKKFVYHHDRRIAIFGLMTPEFNNFDVFAMTPNESKFDTRYLILTSFCWFSIFLFSLLRNRERRLTTFLNIVSYIYFKLANHLSLYSNLIRSSWLHLLEKSALLTRYAQKDF